MLNKIPSTVPKCGISLNIASLLAYLMQMRLVRLATSVIKI